MSNNIRFLKPDYYQPVGSVFEGGRVRLDDELNEFLDQSALEVDNLRDEVDSLTLASSTYVPKIAVASSGSAQALWDTATGSVNGSNTDFVLPSPGGGRTIQSATILPIYNGMPQADFTYTSGTRTVTMGFAPNANSGNEMIFTYSET